MGPMANGVWLGIKGQMVFLELMDKKEPLG